MKLLFFLSARILDVAAPVLGKFDGSTVSDVRPDLVESVLSTVHPLLRVRLFSTMDVRGPDGMSLLPKGRKTRGVLAVLALNAGRPVMRDELTELLWSRRERDQARASLRQAVHELGDL